jgi:hypothetical protein
MDFPRKGKPTMKKMLFAVSALAALSLLAPSTGLAQTHNIMGIYADEAGTVNSINPQPAFTPVDLYVVLHNPYNEVTDAPITAVNGVEFGLTLDNVLSLSTSFPVNATDVGGSPTNIVAGFATPATVSGGSVVLATINCLVQSAAAGYIGMTPATPSSAPGFMATLDAAVAGQIIPVLPPWESFDYNVFAFNETVASEPMTMGNVKALYR